jgi:DNA-binding MarR family transcriptional regulator
MSNSDILEQARFIVKTGKLIRDRVFRNITCQSADGKNGEFGELSMSQIHAIHVTRDRGSVAITELAGILGVSPPSASAMVDRLVDKGVFRRDQSKEDRRKVVVTVSPKAMEKFEQIEKNILQTFVELIEKIGPETTCKWCEVLERVKEVQEQEG